MVTWVDYVMNLLKLTVCQFCLLSGTKQCFDLALISVWQTRKRTESKVLVSMKWNVKSPL